MSPSDKPTPREEYRTLVRRRIIAAGLKCFEAMGYDASTMEAIAKEANISRTGIYLHFKYKSDIIYQAVSEIEPLWRKTFIDAFPLHWDSEENVRIGTARMFEMYRTNISLMHIILQAAAIEQNVSDWLESVLQDHVSGILDKLVGDSPQTPVEKSHLYARVWIAVTATDNVFKRALDPRWSIDEKVAIEEIARMWISIMGVDDAGSRPTADRPGARQK